MTIVAQVIKNKSEQDIFTISPEATVLEAIKIMADKGIGALVVADGEKVANDLDFVAFLHPRRYYILRDLIEAHHKNRDEQIPEFSCARTGADCF